jgi:hypothetical protein
MIFIIPFCILQFQLVNGNYLMAMPMIQDLPSFVQSSKSDSLPPSRIRDTSLFEQGLFSK